VTPLSPTARLYGT